MNNIYLDTLKIDGTSLKEITNWTKEISLGLTDSISIEEYHKNINKLDNIDIKNLEECISIYDLIASFNKLYILFKKDLEQLEKLPFSTSIIDQSFFENKSKYLTLLIANPPFYNGERILLEIKEENNKINTYITNGLSAGENLFYNEINLGIDRNIYQSYLDLFQKNKLFLELYRFLRNKFIGTNISSSGIAFRIDCKEGSLFNGLSSMNIYIGSASINNEEKCEVVINLGEEMKLDLDKCQLQFWTDNPINATKETYEYILKNIFINGNRLEESNNTKSNSTNKAKILKKYNKISF